MAVLFESVIKRVGYLSPCISQRRATSAYAHSMNVVTRGFFLLRYLQNNELSATRLQPVVSL